MRSLLITTSAGLALTCAAAAQRLAAYDPMTATMVECQPASIVLPGPVPPLMAYPQVPPLPMVAVPAGDSTFDNMRGFHWVTNGAVLAAQPTPQFPPAGPIPPVMPIPLPVLAAIGGGPVTGIALDAVAGVMYLTGAVGVTIGVAPVPGMPVLVPPFPVPFLTGPITGLEWDSMTGTLIACDAAAVTYTYLPGGIPAGPPAPPPMALLAMATDVALDRTLAPNAFGLRSLYVLAGPAYYDVRDPAPIPQPVGMPMCQGLAFLNHPASQKPLGPCVCPATTYPGAGPTTNSVMTSGNAGWAVQVVGLPPGFPVIFGFDVAGFIPFFPIINPPVGCGLGLTLTGSTLFFVGVADPFGTAAFPVPLIPPSFPLGTGPIFNQNATFCAADPAFNLVLTPMQTIYSCAP
ncbi:MAG: hypothetical protein JNL08_19480 [Planctomycetes bacterium]|nr:hypothetical protein [Planctomycetota bacterium]